MSAFHTALRGLRHPATLVSIGLLLLNDHFLKAAAPSPLTGKLSDFAGLFFFPFLLAAALSLMLDRGRVCARTTGALAFALTGVWFALVKTVPWANALTEAALSRALGFPARIVLDPTDVIALIMLWPAWRVWAGAPEREPARTRTGRREWVALAVASLAAIATTPPATPPPTPPLPIFRSTLARTVQPGEITDIALSPDGTHLAVGSTLGVFVYQADTLEQVWFGPSGDYALGMRVAWSADGTRVASGSQTTPTIVWDAATGTPIQTLSGGGIYGLAFWPDGSLLVAAGSDTLTLWDTTTWGQAGTLTVGDVNSRLGFLNPIDRLTFSPDGTRLATGGYSLTVWDTTTRKPVLTEDLRTKITALAFSPAGTEIVVATETSKLFTWEVATGNKLNELDIAAIVQSQQSGYYQGYEAIALSPDGSRVALTLLGGLTLVADTATGSVSASWRFTDSLADPLSMSFNPDGGQLFIASGSSARQTVAVWEAATGTLAREAVLSLSLGEALDVTWAAGGAMLATGTGGSGAGDVILWDLATGHPLRALPGGARWVSAVAFAPDGQTLAAATDVGLMIWQTDTGALARAFEGDAATLAAWSPDGARVLRDTTTTDYLLQLTLVDAATGKTVRNLEGSTQYDISRAHFAYSRDGNTIALSAETTVVLWDAVTGETIKLWQTPEPVTGLAWGPDGNTLALGTKDGSVIVWNRVTERQISWKLPADYQEAVRGLAFSPDGKSLATGARGVIVWEAATGNALGFLDGSALDAFIFVAWSPDGKALVAGKEREVRVWRVGP